MTDKTFSVAPVTFGGLDKPLSTADKVMPETHKVLPESDLTRFSTKPPLFACPRPQTINQERQDSVLYMLNPKDEQSALVVTIGEDKTVRSDAELAKESGFTKLTRHSGIITKHKVVWRSWSNADHLYSDCAVKLSPDDAQASKKYDVHLHVTANTTARRKALEEHLESLRLVLGSKTEEKVAEPCARLCEKSSGLASK